MEALRIFAKETMRWALTGPKFTAVALFLTLFSIVSGSLEHIPYEYAQRLLLIAAAVGLLGFLVSVFKCGAAKRGKVRRLKILGTIMIPVVGAMAFGGSIYLASSLRPSTLDTPSHTTPVHYSAPAPVVTQEPEILAALRSLGAKYSYSDLDLIWINNPTSDCGWSMADGCYQRGKILKMKRGLDPVVFKTVLAHEYLHYVWYAENLDNDKRLTSELIALYARYPEFQRRVEGNHNHYMRSGTLQPTEFFSYGCTEISDAKLGPYIAAKCKQYINTDKLPALF